MHNKSHYNKLVLSRTMRSSIQQSSLHLRIAIFLMSPLCRLATAFLDTLKYRQIIQVQPPYYQVFQEHSTVKLPRWVHLPHVFNIGLVWGQAGLSMYIPLVPNVYAWIAETFLTAILPVLSASSILCCPRKAALRRSVRLSSVQPYNFPS